MAQRPGCCEEFVKAGFGGCVVAAGRLYQLVGCLEKGKLSECLKAGEKALGSFAKEGPCSAKLLRGPGFAEPGNLVFGDNPTADSDGGLFSTGVCCC